MKKKLIKMLIMTFLSSLCFVKTSLALEKNITASISEEYESATCKLYFEVEGDYAIKMVSPSGKSYEGSMINSKEAQITIDKKVDMGDWKIIISNDTEEEIGKVKVEIKANISTATNIDKIKVAKDITGLDVHFSDENIVITWSDISVGNVNVSVKDTKTQRIIKEDVVKNDIRFFSAEIPNTTKQITVSVTPSESIGVDGAKNTYTFDVVRDTDAEVLFPEENIVNTDTLVVNVNSQTVKKYVVNVNDENVIETDYNNGKLQLDIPLAEGMNKIVVFAVDKKKNEVSFHKDVQKDSVAPSITLRNNYDGLATYESSVKIEGNIKDYSKVYINDNLISVESNGNFSYEYALLDGINNIIIIAEDEAGNESVYAANVTKEVKENTPLSFKIFSGIVIALILVILLFPKKKNRNRITENIDGENEKTPKRFPTMKNKKAKEEKEGRNKDFLKKSDIAVIVISAFLFYILFFHVIKIGSVVSSSMAPTFDVRTFVVANRLAYKTEEPQRGDIISIECGENSRESLGKRIIGLPGEKIEFIDGYVYIDGTKLTESYIEPDIETNCDKTFLVPEGCYFVMGDNRENSIDSRYWTNPYVEKSSIEGKVVFFINW